MKFILFNCFFVILISGCSKSSTIEGEWTSKSCKLTLEKKDGDNYLVKNMLVRGDPRFDPDGINVEYSSEYNFNYLNSSESTKTFRAQLYQNNKMEIKDYCGDEILSKIN